MLNNLNSAEIQGKNVLLRIDSDVPIKDGRVIDDKRLQASIPTLKYLLENGAKVTVIGHIDRPGGKEVSELKMRPVEDKLIELLGTHQNWQILENLRFNAGEERNDPEFARQLATGQDLFVQDAFATCHRLHASTVGVKKLLPSFAGFSVQKEVENLSKLLAAADPTIIVGGKKAKDKLPAIGNLSNKAKVFLVGGVVANTFIARQGIALGKSLVENEVFSQTDEILKNLVNKLLLPHDLVISKSLDEPIEMRVVNIDALKDLADYFVVDIGPETVKRFTEEITSSSIIFWNGNMGVSEVEEFSRGTRAIAEAIVASGAKKYAGGGDTTSFIRKMEFEERFDFLSNGGGATLEFLAGKTLPGL